MFSSICTCLRLLFTLSTRPLSSHSGPSTKRIFVPSLYYLCRLYRAIVPPYPLNKVQIGTTQAIFAIVILQQLYGVLQCVYRAYVKLFFVRFKEHIAGQKAQFFFDQLPPLGLNFFIFGTSVT